MRKVIDLRKKIPPIPESGPRFRAKSIPAVLEKKIPSIPPVDRPTVISWSGPLFYHTPDMRAVWIVSVSLFAIAALFQVFQKNLITTVFFGMLGLMILIHAQKRPPRGIFEISPPGVRINDQLHHWREIKSFWIDYQPNYGIKELSLHVKKWYLPYLKIPLGNQNPVQIRSLLIQFIPEVEHEETLADAIARRLGL